MSVKRRDLVKYLEENGFALLREGKKHSIYARAETVIPVKRHRTLDRITSSAPVARLNPACPAPISGFRVLTGHPSI